MSDNIIEYIKRREEERSNLLKEEQQPVEEEVIELTPEQKWVEVIKENKKEVVIQKAKSIDFSIAAKEKQKDQYKEVTFDDLVDTTEVVKKPTQPIVIEKKKKTIHEVLEETFANTIKERKQEQLIQQSNININFKQPFELEKLQEIALIEKINDIIKFRDPVLEKMEYREWLKVLQNKMVDELHPGYAKKLYEQDMSRVEKYEELKKKSGKGRNRVAQITSEETAPLSDPIIPSIWGKPATGHAYDDEFESNTLDAAWAAPYGPSSTPATTDTIDPYDGGWSPANEGRYNINTTHRPSFLMLQGNNTWVQANKPITLATNMFCYVKFSFHSDISISNNEVLGEIRFGQDGNNNAAKLTFANTDTNKLNVDYKVNISGSENTVGTTTDIDSKGQAIEYAAIHKVGTTYHGWAGTESNWIYLGSDTANYNSSGQVGLLNVSAESEKIVGFDFVRFIETDKFPF